MYKMEYDLSKPAFGPGAEKLSTQDQPEVVAPQAETVIEAPVAPEPEASVDATEEEQRVPYSRFKKYHDRALQAEQEAAEWRAKAEERPEPVRASETSDMPSSWVKLYGDSDDSKEAWKIQEQREQELIERARREAVDAVKSERYEEEKRVSKNEEAIDADLDALKDYAGRPLTEREQSAILDIVDDFTPKDDKGNYLGATIPFEKAWDIYELKQQASKAPRTAARNSVAALTGSPTQGEPSSEEANKSFNPLDWGAYKKRL